MGLVTIPTRWASTSYKYGLITPLIGVTTPGKSMYFRPFIGVIYIYIYNSSYNELGAHLVKCWRHVRGSAPKSHRFRLFLGLTSRSGFARFINITTTPEPRKKSLLSIESWLF